MKKETGKYLAILLGIICLILAIILIYVKVMAANNKSSEKDLNNKIEEEIKYLDSNIIKIMNKLNNITVINYKVYTREINDPSGSKGASGEDSSKGNSSSSMQEGNSSSGSSSGQGGQSGQGGSSGGESSQGGGSQGQEGSSSGASSSSPITVSELIPNTIISSNNNETNWVELAYLLENIYSTWPTINLDLQEKGISSEMIDVFSLSMNGAIQALKNQDKGNTLVNLYNMYVNLPRYINATTSDASKINLYNTKANILNAYVLATTSDKWNDITNSVIEAKNNFNTILTSENDDKNTKTNLQKTYVILEDLERASKLNDKEIFLIGYKNVIQQLETM